MTRLRGERGFTLIELQVVIVLMIVVLGAVLSTFNQNEANQRVNQDQTDAQEQNRRAVDTVIRQLRNLASSSTQTPQAVEKVAPYELVFQTVKDQGIVRVRYCLGASQGGKATLLREEQAGPLPPFTPPASCPAGPGWSNQRAVAEHLVNREQGVAIFVPDTTDVLSVNSFRVEMLVDVNPGRSPLPSRLSSGVFLRNQNRAPIAAATATATGTEHRLLLNGSGSEDPEGSALVKYEWFADGSLTTPIATGPVANWASPGPFPRQHSFTLRVTDSGGRTGEFTTGPVTVN
ncbi:MAG: hypothetical protein WKF96_21140 [Solirubrobacteraceae bacterium]